MWTYNSPISIDRDCLCQMGIPVDRKIEKRITSQPRVNPLIGRMFRCSGCNIMRRLFDLEKHDINEPFTIECGRYRDRKMVMTKIPISVLNLTFSGAPRRYLDLILREEDNIKVCEPTVTSLQQAYFLGSDKFTNQLLTTWYLDYILSQHFMNHINKIETAFICSNHGYFLLNSPDIGKLNDFVQLSPYSELLKNPSIQSDSYLRQFNHPIVILKSETIKNILKQLISTLHLLRKHDFSYGGVDYSSLVFYSDRTVYNYDGVKVDANFTLKLDQFASSGVTVKSQDRDIRLYHRSELAESQIDDIPFRPIVQLEKIFDSKPPIKGGDRKGEDFGEASSTTCPQNFCSQDRYYPVYQLRDAENNVKYETLFLYLQHLGIPLYQSSFDTYSFMVMLMSNFSFYGGVSEDPQLFEIWKSMWLPHQFNDVNIDIRKFHSPESNLGTLVSRIDIVEFLSKYKLRCDVNDLLWTTIKEKF